MVVDLREDNLKGKNVWVAKPKSPHTVLREHGACASAAIRGRQASTALCASAAGGAGLRKGVFQRGKTQGAAAPCGFHLWSSTSGSETKSYI